jgi:hypothetical protein
MKKLTIIILSILLLFRFTGLSQNLVTGEYFFDTDPGVGNGIPMSFAADDTIDIFTDLSISGLSAGFHRAFIRIKDETGLWSLFEGRPFYIQPASIFTPSSSLSSAEYFFDDDPGPGNGISVQLNVSDTVDTVFEIPLAGLEEGFHMVCVRTQDIDGSWSIATCRVFYIKPTYELPIPGPVSGMEYFFNNDPGPGNGTPVTASESDTLDLTFNADPSALNEGVNYLFVRVRDTSGTWSFYQRDTFRIFTCSNYFNSYPYLEGFEDGANGWSTGGTDPSWELGTPSNIIISSASSGENAWVTDLDGDHNNNEASYIESPCFNFSQLSTPTIDLDIWYNTDGNNDGAALLATKDGGGTWIKIGAFGDTTNWYDKDNITSLNFTENLHGWGGTITNWKTSSHILTDFAGEQYVKFRIVFGSNDATAYEGIGVDNIRIYDAISDLSVNWVSPPDDPDCGTTGDQSIVVDIINPGSYPVHGFNISYSVDEGETFINDYCTETINPGASFEYTFSTTANMSAIDTFRCIAAVISAEDENHSNDTARLNVINNRMVIGIVTEDTYCKQAVGTAQATVSRGGTGPYSYAWTNGDTGEMADSLASGIHMVTVTDTHGCQNFSLATINDMGGPQIATESDVTNVSCNGGSDGAIDIAVSGGTMPYTYSWSNGATTQDIQNIEAGPYEVIVYDADSCVAVKSFIISEPEPYNFSSSIIEATCGAADGIGTLIVSGGTAPYSYAWETGSGSPTEVGLAVGVYKVKVTDANACVDTASVIMTENGAPRIILNSIVPAQCGLTDGALYVSISAGSGDYSYFWSSGATTQDLENVPSGTYTLTVSDNQGTCDGVASYSIPPVFPESNPICLVTVDSATHRNLVVWEKINTTAVAEYHIYRESSIRNVFQLIGSRSVDSLSVFLDSVADPSVRSWRYRISVVDSCGNESLLSDSHKTIHLTMNVGLNNKVNLIWDHYEGFDVTTYDVYRYSSAGWEKLTSLPSNLTSYTDNSPPVDELLTYMIEVVHPSGGCIATEGKSSTYNTSRSNRTQTVEVKTGLEGMKSQYKLNIYPNPARDWLTIDLTCEKPGKFFIEMVNIHGQTVYSGEHYLQGNHHVENIALNGLAGGFYILKLRIENELLFRKITIH